ncbi:hypothetical protein HYV71_04000 [Candidatus Uhrbacteria bacterium]|nr:hypothetical protein [Candidatus Uhrbacteria bacterium]
MKLYSIELDSLPENIQEALWSDEFFQFRYNLHLRYPLTEVQDAAFDTVLGDLFAMRISVDGLTAVIKERLNCDAELATELSRLTMLNTVLVFPEHFDNQWQHYKNEFKRTEDDLNESRTYFYLISQMEENFRKGIEKLRMLDFEKEALQIKKIFQTQLVGYLRLTESMPLIALNALIFAIIRRKETFPVELQQVMLDNEEEIGTDPITPRILEWVRDLLASSDKEGVSSLSIAKYITQNPNAKKLSEENREAVRRLFEAYYTLKNFPDSLAKVPPTDWVIIPYARDEIKEVSAARLARASATANLSREPAVTVAEQITTLSQSPSEVKNTSMEVSEKTVPQEFPSVDDFVDVRESTEGLSATSIAPAAQMAREDNNDSIIKPSYIPMPPQDYDKLADEIIADVGLAIAPDISSRLRTSIVTRLRNVRNDTQTKLRLMDSVEEGGIGLTSHDAERVLDAIKKSMNAPTVSDRGKEVLDISTRQQEVHQESVSASQSQPVKEEMVSEQLQSDAADKEPQPSTLAASPVPPAKSTPSPPPPPPPLSIKEDENGVPTIVEEVSPLQNKLNTARTGFKNSAPSGKQGTDTRTQTAEQPSDGPAPLVSPIQPLPSAMQGKDVKRIPVQIRPGSTVGKVPVSDVKAPPRLLDAVEEMRVITLKDFRRLSPNPEEAAGKILKKFALIEKDSYTKKMSCIAAWKENEVSRLYQEIGKESFGAGVNIADVIEKRKAAGKPYLTAEEFEALLELNEQIRI